METDIAREAIRRIRATGAEIRSQAPLLAKFVENDLPNTPFSNPIIIFKGGLRNGNSSIPQKLYLMAFMLQCFNLKISQKKIF